MIRSSLIHPLANISRLTWRLLIIISVLVLSYWNCIGICSFGTIFIQEMVYWCFDFIHILNLPFWGFKRLDKCSLIWAVFTEFPKVKDYIDFTSCINAGSYIGMSKWNRLSAWSIPRKYDFVYSAVYVYHFQPLKKLPLHNLIWELHKYIVIFFHL